MINMDNFVKAVKEYLDRMTPEEIDAMLVELGNDKASPGPMFMSREDFKKRPPKYGDLPDDCIMDDDLWNEISKHP